MANLGKEIENENKCNEKKRGPCMTLTLPWICFIQNIDFKKDQIFKKQKLEKWPIGYEAAK